MTADAAILKCTGGGLPGTVMPALRRRRHFVKAFAWLLPEVAETLATSVASVNSALQRARSSLTKRNTEEPAELTHEQQAMLDRYAAAFENYNVPVLVALMQQDVTFCMPPYSLWLQGPQDVGTWMLVLDQGAVVLIWFRLSPQGGPHLRYIVPDRAGTCRRQHCRGE